MRTPVLTLFLKKETLRLFTFLLLVGGTAFSQSQFKVLYDFNGADGSWPQSLIFDHSGNLYGTTAFGGNSQSDCNFMGCGTVFELVRNTDGSWAETVLYAFCSVGSNCSDGFTPNIALVFDAAGNLYGTTLSGGANGAGAVYELTPNGQGGAWSINVLYNFCTVGSCADGESPTGALAMDAAGNLYGTTVSGGSNFDGTVFELSPPLAQGDPWMESILYNFCGDMDGKKCLDGFDPNSGITLSNVGNLYGTTSGGGQYSMDCREGCGTVFELSPSLGSWNYTRLYAPPSTLGAGSTGPLITTSLGSVYGAFSSGGANAVGALFRVVASGRHDSFSLLAGDGSYPEGPLVLANGVIYGSANGVGSDVPGTIFQVTPSRQESVLHTFCSQKGCADGTSPRGLIRDGSGTLLGVASGGGSGNHGVVFALKP